VTQNINYLVPKDNDDNHACLDGSSCNCVALTLGSSCHNEAIYRSALQKENTN